MTEFVFYWNNMSRTYDSQLIIQLSSTFLWYWSNQCSELEFHQNTNINHVSQLLFSQVLHFQDFLFIFKISWLHILAIPANLLFCNSFIHSRTSSRFSLLLFIHFLLIFVWFTGRWFGMKCYYDTMIKLECHDSQRFFHNCKELLHETVGSNARRFNDSNKLERERERDNSLNASSSEPL